MTGSFRGFDSPTPSQLGKYRVDSIIGRGAMGVVYKGYDPDLQQAVAIKTIRQELLDDSEAETILKRFRNEAIAGRRLKHPNIVSTYDYSTEAQNCFIVMEYVEGRRLKDIFTQQQRLSVDETLRVMDQLLDGLHYAHENGVIHRDINPGNLMFGDEGQLLIMDFGIAKLQASNLTLTMMVVGTPSYMSPEQCLGQPIDARTDIFSAGIVLYQLLTGEKPFQGDSLVTTMHQVVNKSPEHPSRLNAQVPRAFDRIVQKALSKNKEHRYQTAADFARALREAGLRMQRMRSEKTEALRPLGFLRFRRPSLWTVVAVAAIVFTLLCAVAIYKALAGGAEPPPAVSIAPARPKPPVPGKPLQSRQAEPPLPAAIVTPKPNKQVPQETKREPPRPRLVSVPAQRDAQGTAKAHSRPVVRDPTPVKQGTRKTYSPWAMMQPAQWRGQTPPAAHRRAPPPRHR
jgi:serine/threonine-protein kinase